MILCELLHGLAFAVLFLLPANGREQLVVFRTPCRPAQPGGGDGDDRAQHPPRRRRPEPLPVVIVGAVTFALTGQVLGYAMAAFAIVAGAFFLALSARFYETALTMMQYRIEKDGLIAEVEQAKAVSDESRRRAERPILPSPAFSPP